MVFEYTPATELVTKYVIVHTPGGLGGVDACGILPPVRVTEPLVLVMTPPLHCGVIGVPETVKFEGRLSVKFTPV